MYLLSTRSLRSLFMWFPTVVGPVHPMSASLGPSHKLPVCPQTKRKITPKPSKDPRHSWNSWDAQEPETFLAAVLPTMDKRMSENSALKMSASSLEKFRNGLVRRLETSFLMASALKEIYIVTNNPSWLLTCLTCLTCYIAAASKNHLQV